MLSEGLHENDLDGVIIPVISIDEYHGKIDDSSIVISFFLTDPNAALDLSSFIESGPFEILDSDVSKAINEDGYYQVFIEMERTDDFFNELKEILMSVNDLSHDLEWSFMTPRTKGEDIPFDEDQLKQYLFYKPAEPTAEPEDEKTESMTEAVMDFLSNSNAHNVKIIDDSIIFENQYLSSYNKFVTFSDSSLINHILNLSAKKSNVTPSITENMKKLSSILGNEWLIESAGQFILISSDYSPNKILLLK